MIRVCLIDDQTLVRQGIRSLLELSPDIEVVGEADNGKSGLELIEASRPDVVLLDIRMPELDGIGVLRVLSERSFFPPVLVLTTFDDDALLLEALRMGVKGYLLKDVSLQQLVGAIKALHEGKTLVQPALTERLLHGLPHVTPGSFEAAEALTERETEILRLMSGGYSNKEIAGALDLSEGTVKNHVSSVLAKLGVRDRTRAVLKGLEQGLI